MKIFIKNYYDTVAELWQTKDDDYKSTLSGGIIFIAFSAVVCGGICAVFESSNLSFLIKVYLPLLLFLVGISFVSVYFYVQNDIDYSDKQKHVLTISLLLLLLLTLLVSLPVSVLVIILNCVIKNRAKTLGNLIDYTIILGITVFVMLFVFVLCFFLGIILGDILEPVPTYLSTKLLKTEGEIHINLFSLKVFLVIFLNWLMANIIFSILVHIYRRKKYKKANKELVCNQWWLRVLCMEEKGLAGEVNIDDDIEYSVKYMNKTFKIFQLSILMIMFVIIIFEIVPLQDLGEIGGKYGDIMGVLTTFTLIIMYLDKIRDWK